MVFINELIDDTINEPINDSYKRAFNDTINELFTSLKEPSLVVFKLQVYLTSLEIELRNCSFTLINKLSP